MALNLLSTMALSMLITLALNLVSTMTLNLRLDSAKVVNELMVLCHKKISDPYNNK